jgi:hypothetical protein
MMEGAFEYARVVRDLHSTNVPLSILTYHILENPVPGWKCSLSSIQAHIRDKLENNSNSADSSIKSTSDGRISKLLAKSVSLISERDELAPTPAWPISGRIVLFCSQGVPQFNDSWLYTESDGTQLSIPDYIDNLVSENNYMAASDPHIAPIERLELCILVFVPERPMFPQNQPSSSSTANEIPISHEEEASKIDTKPVDDASETRHSTNPLDLPETDDAPKDGIYHQEPSCFSDGTQMPPSKLVSGGLKFVIADLNFIRPSFTHQAIGDLVTSHFQLDQVNIYGMPLKEGVLDAIDSRIIPIPLLTNSPNQSPLFGCLNSDHIMKRPHIGHQLGTGLKPARNMFWKNWDPQLSIHGLPCDRIMKVTPCHPSHLASLSLLGSVLTGRPVLLSSQIPFVDDETDAPPSMILMRHGNHVYIHELRERDEVSMLKLEGLDVESQFGRSTLTMRFNAMRNLIDSNTFLWTRYQTDIPSGELSEKSTKSTLLTESVQLGPMGASEDFSKTRPTQKDERHEQVIYKTTRALECGTRIFPLFEQDTVCFQPDMTETAQRYIVPLISSLMRVELPEAVIPLLKKQIEELSQMTQNNDPIMFFVGNHRGSVAKRREMYSQMWKELLTIAKKHKTLSPVHSALADFIRTSAPDQTLTSSIFNDGLPIHRQGNAMDIDSEPSAAPPPELASTDLPPRFTTEKDDEARFLNDISNVRHDIVGLKDLSWAGGTIALSSVPHPASSFPSGSLYNLYWQAHSPSKPLDN